MPWAHGCAGAAHMLFFDGVFTKNKQGKRKPKRTLAPDQHERGSFLSTCTGVAAQNRKREKLERLCRYISRPAVSEKRLPTPTIS